MFGYVRVFKPELTYREYEQYRGVYCSFCRSLGKRYGLLARMTLSYDFTFLALFKLALNDRSIGFKQGRCPFKPTKKCSYCTGDGTDVIDHAADIAVILTFHKLSDTVEDERFFRRVGARFLRMLYKRHFRCAVKRRPEEAQWAWDYMQAQGEVEKQPIYSIDPVAHPTATFLSKLAATDLSEDVPPDEARRFGYCLGRFVYLADAADDMEKDLKSGSFNPYVLYGTSSGDGHQPDMDALRRYAAQTLHSSIAVCAECYEALPIKRFDGIVHNVIYWGMPSVVERIQKSKQEETLHEKSL